MGTLGSKRDVSTKGLPSGLYGMYVTSVKGQTDRLQESEVAGDSKATAFPRHNRNDAYENPQRLTA